MPSTTKTPEQRAEELLRAGLSLAAEVEAGIAQNNEEARKAWREGRLPTAEPPASPIFTIDGTGL